MKRFLQFLNVLSAGACLVVGTLLTLELWFVVSVENRELFSAFNTALLFYFLVDVVLRALFFPNRTRTLIGRVTDLVILVPLVGGHLLGFDILANYHVVQAVLLTVFVGRITHLNELFRFLRFNPAQLFVVGFLLLIFVGALLLSLPAAHVDQPLAFVDALFTSTSAVCVTGLVTKDTATYFTPFGHAILMVLIQIGGLGIMAFYALATLVLNKKMSHGESIEYRESLTPEGEVQVSAIIKLIFKFTLFFELVGAALLFVGWRHMIPDPIERLFFALFHAISAFCNAGFALFSDSLISSQGNVLVILTLSVLIFSGGMGFPVISNLLQRRVHFFHWSRLKMQTKLSLSVSAILVVLGTLAIAATFSPSATADMDTLDIVLSAFFHSVSARTAGFNAIDMAAFSQAGVWFVLLLMFIGASPGSTGGGIKTTTFGVLVASLWGTIRGHAEIDLFERRISTQNIVRVVSLIMLSAVVISGFLFLLLMFEDLPFLPLFFEVVSAFGTVGYSLGITPLLSSAGKVCIILLMLIGRVGPLTFAFALARRQSKSNYHYPEERILVG